MKLDVYLIQKKYPISDLEPFIVEYIASNTNIDQVRERYGRDNRAEITIERVGGLEVALKNLIPSQCCSGGEMRIWIKNFESMVRTNEEGKRVPKWKGNSIDASGRVKRG